MRLNRRRLLVSAVVVAGLFFPAAPAPAAPTATVPDTKPQTITGTVQTVIREQPPGHPAIPDTGALPGADAIPDADDTTKVLRVGTRIIPLTDGSLPATTDGAKVSVTVAPAPDGTKRVLSATAISAPVAPAIPSTHQVHVALVVPKGITPDASLTPAAVRAMVLRASQYWSSQTGNKVSFATAQVTTPYRSAFACGDTYNMWTEALARMPVANGPGRHLVLVSPAHARNLGCAYGMSTIGAVQSDGNKVFISGLNQSLLAHELGHNLGLTHANSLRCGSAQDRPMISTGFPGCIAKEYDDLFDVMGYSATNFGEGSLNAVHLDRMNLLPQAVRKILANSGVTTARITPLSTVTASRTLKITDPNGANYFVEYRTNSGRDAFAGLNPWKPSWGVRVLRDDPQAPPSAGSHELDATPTSLTHDYNRAIPVGGTFTSASRKLTIKVTAADAAGATLTIANSAAPTVPFRVTVSIPTRRWVGTVMSAATTVTDRYGRAAVNWGVTLQKMQRGTTTWKSVKYLRTSSTGAASHRFANGVSGSYRWLTSAVTGVPSRFSASVAVTSTARVTEKRPALSVTAGKYLSVYGSVSSVPSPVVYIQYRYSGGTWQTGPRATVSGTSVSGRIKLSVRKTAYTRLSVRTATSYVGSVSGSYATTVT